MSDKEIANLKADLEKEKEVSHKLYLQQMRLMKENTELQEEIDRMDEVIGDIKKGAEFIESLAEKAEKSKEDTDGD